MWTSLRMCQTPKQAFNIFKLHTYSYMLNSTTVWILKVVENRKPQEERTDNEQVSSDNCLIMYWKYWLMNLDNTLNQEFRPTLQTSFLLKSCYASYKSISNFWSRQTLHNKPTLYWNANPSIARDLKEEDIQEHMLFTYSWLARNCSFFLKKQSLLI